MKKLWILFFLFYSFSQANNWTNISIKMAKEDLKKGNMAKYKYDNLNQITPMSLVSRNIIESEQSLTRDIPLDFDFGGGFRSHITCAFVGEDWTATIYNFNPKAGIVTCMVAKKGDLYNPIGIFDTYYPNLKQIFLKNIDKAEKDKSDIIAKADVQFLPLQQRLNDIYKSTTIQQDSNYLTIPQLLTAAILTDTDIIDVEATNDTDKLQLKENYTSKYFDVGQNEFIDNSNYILTDAETLFKVYTGLSDVSIVYLILLIAFFGIWGISKTISSHVVSKVEDKQKFETITPFGVGIIAGILLFFPTGYSEDLKNDNGEVVAQYEIMKTKYQDFEKIGYSLFTNWADDAAKVIIDAEMDAIIDKSGVATKQQIIDTTAGLQQYTYLRWFTSNVWDICRQDIYKYDGLFDSNDKHHYSSDPNMPFPTNEKWAYVSSLIKGETATKYYSPDNIGEVHDGSGYNSIVLKKISEDNKIHNYYPEISMSACGRLYYLHQRFTEVSTDYENSYELAIGSVNNNNTQKIAMIESLIKFQYELYRDWGYLSILGLPVTKMQTEYVGGLYKSRRSEVLDNLNKEVGKDSMGGVTHTVMSSIPYMFIPGAGTVFQTSMSISKDIKKGINDSLPGKFFTALGGGVATSVAASAAGLSMGYQVSKTVLEITPIVGIVIIGLVRFIIIMIKIFSFHFASLFMMPIMFAKENIQAISRFSIKIFATMLELPIFVLAVWLAITANSLIHTIGDVFGKKIIIGMLENNDIQYDNIDGFSIFNFNGEWLSKLKIYVFDGFIEVALSVFSIVIIYKLIISLHNTLFELLEVQASNSLDNTLESMKNESSSWGSRI